jgi:hypothetical protein
MSDTTELAVLSAMLNGEEVLTLQFHAGRPVWGLMCAGQRISARTAKQIIDVADDALSQAYSSPQEREREEETE